LNDLIKRIDKTGSTDRRSSLPVDLDLFVRQTILNSFAVKKVNQAQVSRHEKFHVKREYHVDQFSAS